MKKQQNKQTNKQTKNYQTLVVCLDAKVNFDDNAAFRQKEIFAMRDMSQEDTREVQRFIEKYINLI